ncbi:hypothetical protein JOE40_003983 [Arthrobacter sp. PvP102]|uniref:tautomerase family protein n=1 Tax=unclassified Arthrobacter TaxID=235627 RepID=UPI0000527643|nr:4-oxalocrotonate tautomerase [Arthrobacter sp. FB24]MBP1234340.1 hypothetical protein [Arthrobacter sp. PvP103]MBP1239474.1 hypothetical protein [Arthrobacter sp. PvP102]
MPLARIDVNEGRSPEGLRRLSRGLHNAVLAECGIPERDYFHIIAEHPRGQIFAQDAELGVSGEDVFIGYVEKCRR